MQLLHGRVPIELHCLKPAQGEALLLLHALGSNAEAWRRDLLAWDRGPVYALDFAGHGKSGRVRGGAYYPEYFLADADLALETIDAPCVLIGAGVGAYVALLMAGSRPTEIRAAALLDGPGLAGGGSLPEHELAPEEFEQKFGVGIEGFERFIEEESRSYGVGTDPLVAQCERDIRPLDYVESFARDANPLVFDDSVGRASVAPDWWRCARDVGRAPERAQGAPDLLERLARLATAAARDAT